MSEQAAELLSSICDNSTQFFAAVSACPFLADSTWAQRSVLGSISTASKRHQTDSPHQQCLSVSSGVPKNLRWGGLEYRVIVNLRRRRKDFAIFCLILVIFSGILKPMGWA